MSQTNPQTTTTKRLARTERRLQVLQLTEQGNTCREIGARLGVSAATVSNDLKAVLLELSERQAKQTEQWRGLEASRLDTLQAGAWEKARTGNLAAIEAVLSIMVRRAKLLGLDQPVRVDLSGEVAFHVEEALNVLEQVLPREEYKKALEALANAA